MISAVLFLSFFSSSVRVEFQFVPPDENADFAIERAVRCTATHSDVKKTI